MLSVIDFKKYWREQRLMRVMDYLDARGHPLIAATHPTTFEVTKEDWMTSRGTCIIGVKASKAAFDLSEDFKRTASVDGSRIKVVLEVNGVREEVHGLGCSKLGFTDGKSLVCRKSGFTCGRTLMVHSDKAAVDLSRSLISMLKNPNARLEIQILAEL
jgi:hypothetical protein